MRSLLLGFGFTAVLSASAPVTFHKDVLPVLQARCQGCHRPGEAAPMSFLTYKDARPWAKAMRQAVLSRKMPPWFADPQHGKFVNDASLTRQEIDTLAAWADGGAIEGDPKDTPKPIQFVQGWVIGEPDVVFELPVDFHVPASGAIDYQHFIVPTGFTEDKWVQMAEVRPGNRSVVHHVLAYVRESGSTWLRDAKPGQPTPLTGIEVLPGGVLAGYAPGLAPAILAPGMGILVKAGSDLVIQMHYTANGKAATDRTKVGLIFSKNPPEQRVVTLAAHNRAFEIPAGAPNHRVDSELHIEQPMTLLSMLPHMHFRGKSFEYRAVYPDGRTEILLNIPKYDFNWQLLYASAKPVALPKGTRIECTASFDNSANNPFNPDPTKSVRWGDQTWEEMMVGWIYVAVDAKMPPSKLVRERDSAPSE